MQQHIDVSDAVFFQVKNFLISLETISDDLKIGIAEASLDGDLDGVEQLASVVRAAQKLGEDFRALVNDSDRNNKHTSTKRTRQGNSARKNSPRTRLRVTVNEKILEKRTSAETFALAIAEIGVERVASLKKTLSGAPLVSREPFKGYQNQQKIGDWYITTHANNELKKDLLRTIAAELGIQLVVEIS